MLICTHPTSERFEIACIHAAPIAIVCVSPASNAGISEMGVGDGAELESRCATRRWWMQRQLALREPSRNTRLSVRLELLFDSLRRYPKGLTRDPQRFEMDYVLPIPSFCRSRCDIFAHCHDSCGNNKFIS